MWQHATGFAWAVAMKWQGLVSGGLITAVIAVVEHLKGRSLAKRYYLWIFIVAYLLVAFFLVWRDERISAEQRQTEVADLRGKLEALTKPELSAQVYFVTTGGRARGPAASAGEIIAVFLRITNTGAPSVVTDWKASMVFGDGSTAVLYPAVFNPGVQTITLEMTQGSQFVVSPADDLVITTSQEPIPHNGARIGHVLYVLPGPTDQRDRKAAVVLFKDVIGRAYEIRYAVGSRERLPQGATPYMPGLRGLRGPASP